MATTKKKQYEWCLLELDHFSAVTIFLRSTRVLYLKAIGTVYLPNEKAKSRLDRNEVVETDIGWLNLP